MGRGDVRVVGTRREVEIDREDDDSLSDDSNGVASELDCSAVDGASEEDSGVETVASHVVSIAEGTASVDRCATPRGDESTDDIIGRLQTLSNTTGLAYLSPALRTKTVPV